jgi:Fe2+ or Zn2+ uptake regulation protein
MEPAEYARMCRLRAAGLRPTQARLRVLKVIEQASAPMAVDSVFRALLSQSPSINSGAVYRALNDLAATRVLQRQLIVGRNGMRSGFSLPTIADPDPATGSRHAEH